MGQGYIIMDVALFIACSIAALVNIKYAMTWCRQDFGLGLMRLLRVTGWMILSLRFGYVLGSTGDILISVPSAIALFFLAGGEIVAVFLRGKVGKL